MKRSPPSRLTLCHALSNLVAERVGMLKDMAAITGWSLSYCSALLSGKKNLTAAQLNVVLDVCRATEDERAKLNEWGARESGWRF